MSRDGIMPNLVNDIDAYRGQTQVGLHVHSYTKRNIYIRLQGHKYIHKLTLSILSDDFMLSAAS